MCLSKHVLKLPILSNGNHEQTPAQCSINGPTRAKKERSLFDKNRRQYFPVQTEQTSLIIGVLYGFVGHERAR